MNDYTQWLPLLNIPVFWIVVKIYLKTEIRLAMLEEHKDRVEIHLGFKERRVEHG